MTTHALTVWTFPRTDNLQQKHGLTPSFLVLADGPTYLGGPRKDMFGQGSVAAQKTKMPGEKIEGVALAFRIVSKALLDHPEKKE